MDKQKENNESQEFNLPIPKQKKTDLERAKLYLELKKEFKKNVWWYLGKVATAVPIATLVVTGYILWNQTRILENQSQIEERRFESEVAKQFAATVKDLDAKSKSTRLGAVLALENFIDKNEHYRSQVYLDSSSTRAMSSRTTSSGSGRWQEMPSACLTTRVICR